MDSYGIGSYRATWRHPFMASAGSCVSSANQGAHLLELSFETWVITNIAGRWEWAYESRDSTYHFQRVSIVEASLHSFFSASVQPSWLFVPNHHGKCSEIRWPSHSCFHASNDQGSWKKGHTTCSPDTGPTTLGIQDLFLLASMSWLFCNWNEYNRVELKYI